MNRDAWIAVGAAALLATMFAVDSWGGDLWWHLATGRWIIEHGEIPSTDPFSYTAQGRPWRGVYWLSDLILHAAHRGGAMVGVGIVKVTCIFVTCLAANRALRTLDVGIEVRTAATAIAIFILQPRYSMGRPEIIGLAALAISIAVVVDARERPPWLLVPLVLLWQPIHGNAILAVGLAGAWTLSTWIDNKEIPWPGFTVTVICAVSFAITQSGRDTLYLMAALPSSGVEAITGEWRAPSMTRREIWIPVAIIAASALHAMRYATRRPFPLALALGGIVIAARYERNIYPALVLALPATAIALQSTLRIVGKPVRPIAAVVLVVGLAATQVALEPGWQTRTAFGLGYFDPHMPRAAVDRLRTLPPGRVINDYVLGGYLIHEGIEPFWDGRNVALYDAELIRTLYMPARTSSAGLSRVARQVDATYAIGAIDGALGPHMMASTDWLPVEHGRATSLFVRADRADRVGEINTQRDLRVVDDVVWMDTWYGAVLARPNGAEAVRAQLTAALDKSPRSVALHAIRSYLDARHPDVLVRNRR